MMSFKMDYRQGNCLHKLFHAFRDVSIRVTHGFSTSVLKALSTPIKYFSVKGADQKNASISTDDKLCLILINDEQITSEAIKIVPSLFKVFFFFFLHMCFLKML